MAENAKDFKKLPTGTLATEDKLFNSSTIGNEQNSHNNIELILQI